MGRLIVDNVQIKYTTLEIKYKNWIPVTEFVPFLFDIVEVHTACNRKLSAWYTGKGWDGFKMKKHYIVVEWKRIKTREDSYERQKKD